MRSILLTMTIFHPGQGWNMRNVQHFTDIGHYSSRVGGKGFGWSPRNVHLPGNVSPTLKGGHSNRGEAYLPWGAGDKGKRNVCNLSCVRRLSEAGE